MTAPPATAQETPAPMGHHTPDLVRLAVDQLYAGTEHGDPDQLTAAAVYALVAIADSLTRLADRHAPDLANLRPARDDR